ncbi:MAG: glycine cleavage system aminomethyltransferase GcvT [Anaerolineaceae bacterium]|nr:glycine cleavage system aminomethyltransferase GcvT [Anaerolineaceae bacterium]
MKDYLFRGKLSEIDPDVDELIKIEAERQVKKLILIPSESTAPASVREAQGSVFQNLYAEGYPDEETRWMKEDEILNYTDRLANYRRYADPRYYKGVEYADVVEALARRRCAEAFATDKVNADQLFVNVQALSGAPANNAVYHALINPGDTILGMNLLHGGHLTHGSSVNRSGKLYKVVHYNVSSTNEQIDYDQVQSLATENKPKVIIAGYSSYPFSPDWPRFRAIADSVGAILLADVSHIAGLIAAGVLPSPVGHAHVITFTTHKTLCGPRGACIITQDAAIARKIDRAVFPGEQGGPHVHVFAALATTFKLAKTSQFKELHQKILDNCQLLVNQLKSRGLRIPFGGSNTHLGNIDCKTIVGPDGTTLSGDMAARILDIAGIVLNRNTIPGDKTAMNSSGVRFGTPWMTQRGLDEKDMVEVANIIADILLACKPYTVETRQGIAQRAKVDFEVLESAKLRVRALAEKAETDLTFTDHGYPHFYYLNDKPVSDAAWVGYELSGRNTRQFMDFAFSSAVENLKPGESQASSLWTPMETIKGIVTCVDPYKFVFNVPAQKASLTASWLRDLSDGYVAFDTDLTKRLTGATRVIEAKALATQTVEQTDQNLKPYFVGIETGKGSSLPEFSWIEKESNELKRTPLYEVHKKSGAKIIPFAGWEMPVWYTSVVEEHLATRQAAGLFDVSHMGVLQAEGPSAAAFLDCVCGNDIGALEIGESCYTHFLDPDANVIDDTLVYRRGHEKYLVVVNASNNDKDWTWLNAVLSGKVLIDRDRPWVKSFGRNVNLRDLRDPQAGEEMRIDIALQGQKSREILLSLGCDAATKKRIMGLKRTQLCEAVVGGFDMVVSRTGYTGEKMAFELFVHPEKAVALWEALVAAGTPLGLKPCGLGARDSLRTEGGLPLYGHEMGGDLNLGVAEAGFGTYVKVYKPWFIGRAAFMEKEKNRNAVVARFRFQEKGVRMAHLHDPVVDAKGRVIGQVTSCAVDSEGYLTGQAYIEKKYAVEGTPIAIFQSASANQGKAPAELKSGDKVLLPTLALVISRFPKL